MGIIQPSIKSDMIIKNICDYGHENYGGEALRNSFLEQKKCILNEAHHKVVKETLARYGMYPITYYNWKSKHCIYRETGLHHQKPKNQTK